MIPRMRRFAVISLFALWWGGLTFYSAVVVPLGAERFGTTEQGFVAARKDPGNSQRGGRSRLMILRVGRILGTLAKAEGEPT